MLDLPRMCGFSRRQTGRNDRSRQLRPDLADLFLPAAAAALRRLGQRRGAAAAAGAWRARPLPQLGLGGRRRCAATGTLSPRICAAMATASGRRTATTSMAGYIYDLAQLIHQQEAGAGDHRRAFARRQYRVALCRPLSGERRQAGRDRGARALRRNRWPSARQKAYRRTDAHLDRRAARASPDACRGATPRSRTPGSACRRRTGICPPNRRATSRNTASTRTRTAPTAGSSTITCAAGRPTT